MIILDAAAFSALNGAGSDGHVLRPRLISAGLYFLPESVLTNANFSSELATLQALPRRALTYSERLSLIVNKRRGVLFDGTLYDNLLITSPWRSLQRPAVAEVTQTDRCQRVEVGDLPGGADPRKPTVACARFELRAFDSGNGDVFEDGVGATTNRCEQYDRYLLTGDPSLTAAESWPDPPGAIRYYAFPMYIHQMTHYPSDNSLWRAHCQFKGFFSGSPPLALEVSEQKWELGSVVSGGRVSFDASNRTVVNEVWINWVFKLVLSPNSVTGRIRVWKNGNAVTLTPGGGFTPGVEINHATMETFSSLTDAQYFKQGIYRAKAHTTTDIVYFGPTKIADNLEDVEEYLV
jgi:hypothetical protein